jgi:GGDEF domain-containing protein
MTAKTAISMRASSHNFSSSPAQEPTLSWSNDRTLVLQSQGASLQVTLQDQNGIERAILTAHSNPPSEILAQAKEIGGQRGFALIEAYLKSQNIQFEIFFPELHTQTTPSFSDPDRLLHLALPKLPLESSIERKDPLTNLYTGAVLNTSSGVQLLEKLVPGEKLLVFFDFNNMGAANRYGQQERVDQTLRSLKEAANQVFGAADIKHTLVRLGGDEFALVIENSQNSSKALKAFSNKLSEQSRGLFSPRNKTRTNPRGSRYYEPDPADAKLIQAEEYAFLRNTVRALRTQFTRDYAGRPFSRSEYAAWLGTELQRLKVPRDANMDCGESALRLAQRYAAEGQGRSPIMSISFSPGVIIPAQAQPEIWRAALRTAQHLVHAVKESNRTNFSTPRSIDWGLVEREAEKESLERAEITESEYNLRVTRLSDNPLKSQSLNALEAVRLNKSSALDPAIDDDTLRYDLIRSKGVGSVLGLTSDTKLNLLKIDVCHFGAINNQLGYARADQLMAFISGKVRDFFPPGLVIRLNGGSVAYVSRAEIPLEQVQELKQGLIPNLRLLVLTEKVEVEIEERLALSAWAEQRPNQRGQYNPEPITAKLADKMISAGDTFESLFSQFL